LSLPEAIRAGAPGLDAERARREHAVRALIEGRRPREIVSSAGARTIGHANLVHAVRAPHQPFRQRSLTALFCPSHVSPCYMETVHARVHVHTGFEYSSGFYPAMEPVAE
jgi:hypothetical protein